MAGWPFRHDFKLVTRVTYRMLQPILFALNTICLTMSDPHSREGARRARGTIYRYTIQQYVNIDRFRARVAHAPHVATLRCVVGVGLGPRYFSELATACW